MDPLLRLRRRPGHLRRRLSPPPLLAAALLLGVWCQEASSQTVRGRLLERDTDRPIALALVLLLGGPADTVARAVTDDQGRFSLASPVAGDFIIQAVALGYESRRAGVFELGPGGEISVDFRIAPDPLAIAGLDVNREWAVAEPPLVRNGFFERLTQGNGTYFTPRDLELTRHTRLTDLLADVSFLTVVNAYPSDRVLIQSGGALCTPAILVDGVLASVIEGQRRRPGAPNEVSGSEGNVEALVSLRDVEAIEVYRTAQALPTQFGMANQTPCGAIVIWTKRR